MSRKNIVFIVFFSLLLSAIKAYAIELSPAIIPSSSEAGVMQRQLQERPIPTTKRSSVIEEPKGPKETPTATSKITFKLTNIILEGNKRYSTCELQQLFQSSLNKEISLADLQKIVHSITVKYREAGYVLSKAILPPQTIKGGVVRVQIIEGYISKLDVTGNGGITCDLIREYGQYVVSERPFQIHTLEYFMLLANDLPGTSVKAVITPSKTVPGSADLDLAIERKDWGAYLAYDNYGTRYLGPHELTFGAALNGVFVGGDTNAIRYTSTTQPHQLQFIEAAHIQPLCVPGLKWIIDGSYTETHPGFILKPLLIVGRSVAFYSDFSYALKRTRDENWYVHLMLNYQNVTSTILNVPFYQDRIRSIVVGASYNGTDKCSGYDTAFLDLEQGFPVWGANMHLNQSRPKGRTRYTKINSTLSRLQALGDKFSVLTEIRGQYTFMPLLASEQFAFGGPDIGRGYDPAEIIGDRALAAKLELRFDTNPDLCFLKNIQYYLFYDAGVLWNLDNLNLVGKQDATALGFGLRIRFTPELTGNGFIAKPLTRPVLTQVILGRNGNSIRGFFQLVLTLDPTSFNWACQCQPNKA